MYNFSNLITVEWLLHEISYVLIDSIARVIIISNNTINCTVTVFNLDRLLTSNDNGCYLTGWTLAIDCSSQSYPISIIKKTNESSICCLFNKKILFSLYHKKDTGFARGRSSPRSMIFVAMETKKF